MKEIKSSKSLSSNEVNTAIDDEVATKVGGLVCNKNAPDDITSVTATKVGGLVCNKNAPDDITSVTATKNIG